MSFLKQYEKIINNEMEKLKNEISIILFTDFKSNNGEKVRKCMACERSLTILEKLAEAAAGKLKVIEFSTEENQDKASKYKIEKIPTILFLDDNEEELIRYKATPEGSELVPFIKTLQYYSGINSYYKDQILTHLSKIPSSEIQLFITLTCPYCPTVLPIVTLFSIISEGKITSEIIDIDANPSDAMEYKVSSVPHAIINEKDHIYGMFTPQDLLDKLTKGKRDFGGMYA
ncbi:MAG: hypothetical protein GF383_03090 [Candidatus Lokiarchaeota archaeon]|nr:hypothetical protein [Candidatus Lokiarchaeota archaeon]MBD3338525.1 hypothetical protein [Candidatus Lokiarchaeota archaeon]